MTSRDFAFWLQGFFEISDARNELDEITGAPLYPQSKGMSAEQVEMVKKHLALVFVHEIDPSMGGKEHQQKLNDLHGNKPGQNFQMRC